MGRLRIRIADLIDGPLRRHAAAHAGGIKGDGAGAGPSALTRQLLIAGGALLAMTATVGSLSLAIGVLLARWQNCVLVFSPDRINECCQGPASTMGNGDGFRFFTWEALSGRCSVRLVFIIGCACRSCRSYLEILGSHQGIFAGCSAGLWKG